MRPLILKLLIIRVTGNSRVMKVSLFLSSVPLYFNSVSLFISFLRPHQDAAQVLRTKEFTELSRFWGLF